MADEPTGALDGETGRHVMQLLWEETRRRDVTVIMVTHNEHYAAVGDRIVRLHSGQVTEVRTNDTVRQPSELLE